MMLKAKRGFYDKQAECYRPTGEVFEATGKRANELLAAGVAEVVEASAESLPAEPVPAVEKKPKRKKG